MSAMDTEDTSSSQQTIAAASQPSSQHTPQADEHQRKQAKHTAASSPSSAVTKEVIDIDSSDIVSAIPISSTSHHISTTPAFTSASFTYVDPTNVSEDLTCALCKLALYKPLCHKPCTNHYCDNCINGKIDPATGATIPATCAECAGGAIRRRDTMPGVRIVVNMLDKLQVRCTSCSQTMARSQYESHWLNSCDQPCPFTAEGRCTVRLPRTQLNQHIDTCPYAPVSCHTDFGCTWSGYREALTAHQVQCVYHAALPIIQRVREESEAKLKEMNAECTSMRITIDTLSSQIRSWRERPQLADGTSYWPVNTLVDCLDTEQSWLIAKIIKVDTVKKLYSIHYVDWDSSWDEQITFGHQRLAPAGTHTDMALVEKHSRKETAKLQQAAAAAGTSSLTSATGASSTPVTNGKKRKVPHVVGAN